MNASVEVAEPLYGEDQVPPYDLSGLEVERDWDREAALENFQSHVFGRDADGPWSVDVEEMRPPQCLGALGCRRELVVEFKGPVYTRRWTILLHEAPDVQGQARPLFLGLNFLGNHSTTPNPWVSLHRSWAPIREVEALKSHEATESGRGVLSRRWPFELMLNRGFSVATVYSGDLEPDRPHAFGEGLRSCFETVESERSDRWGTLAAWAFGLRRSLDAILKWSAGRWSPIPIATGHSRMGKVVLWAAANDERFKGC